MGALNESLVFRVIMPALHHECQAEAEHQNIRECGLEVIMDDIIFFKLLLAIILNYFEVVLQTLQQYFMTIKLCKCMFLDPHQGLIGVDMCDEVNTSEDSKQPLSVLNLFVPDLFLFWISSANYSTALHSLFNAF